MTDLFPRRSLRSLPGLLAAALIVLAGQAAGQGTASRPAGEPFRVMTFNIRFNTPADSLDAWPLRREGVAGLIRFHDPELLGLQEAQRNQLDDLSRLLPAYAWFGQPRADGGPSDEFSAILYRADRFEPLAQGTFWLSPTPDVRGSQGWDARLPRIATWGRFRDRSTGDTLLYLNTHFDHIGVEARAESAQLLARWLAANAAGAPVIATGDFNAEPGSVPVQRLLDPASPYRLHDAAARSAEPAYGPVSTWNGFREIVPGRRIDFIFVGDGVRVLEHATLSETLATGRFPSDHLPVLAEVSLERR